MRGLSFYRYNTTVSNIIIPATDTDPTGFSRHRNRGWNAKNVMAADHLIKMKKDRHLNSGMKRTGTDPVWEVLDEVIKVWKKQRPTEWRSSIIDLKEIKDNLKDKTLGKTAKTGAMRRTLDVPVFIELVMRHLYTIDELPFDKKWYRELWKRHPEFRVAEKL